LCPLRVQPRIADDVELPAALYAMLFRQLLQLLEVDRRWIDEHLSHRTAVDVHFLKRLLIGLDVYHHGWERARDCCRCDEQRLEQLQRSGLTAGCNLGQIPDNRPSSIQVRRSDQQDAPFRVLRGDRIENVLSCVLFDQIPQRRVVALSVRATGTASRRVAQPMGRSVRTANASIQHLPTRSDEAVTVPFTHSKLFRLHTEPGELIALATVPQLSGQKRIGAVEGTHD
jgi:hypothetical protein